MTCVYLFAMRITPRARVTVTQIGRPSGIAATARETPMLNSSRSFLPCWTVTNTAGDRHVAGALFTDEKQRAGLRHLYVNTTVVDTPLTRLRIHLQANTSTEVQCATVSKKLMGNLANPSPFALWGGRWHCAALLTGTTA